VGFLILLIRAFGVWADAVPFAIILMNIVNPLLDRAPVRRRGTVTP
jgi:Na+-translocating ferredoxin:NAD+ oxidoreductase RnfD subunit